MPESSVVTLRLDPKLKKQLERLSKALRRTRSFVAAEAIREYVLLNEWQIAEIQKSLGEAERDDFASEQDVVKVVSKWTRRAH
jgi:RHH-type rel operon transcriptional repressor/antitoxin RelB